MRLPAVFLIRRFFDGIYLEWKECHKNGRNLSIFSKTGL